MNLYPELNPPSSFFEKTPPNDSFWSKENAPRFPDSPLKGKRILFLGSSVTLGLQSHEEAVGDFLEKEDGIILYKEAISGTTLRQEHSSDLSYLSRFQRFIREHAEEKLDAIIVQLSTNDGWDPSKLGTPLANENPETSYGAIEAIATLEERSYGCPLFFYTGAHYEDMNGKTYAQMVEGLRRIAQKRGFGVIDLFSNPEFNVLGQAHYSYWMHDGVHPYRAGYRAWWTPYFRVYLIAHLPF